MRCAMHFSSENIQIYNSLIHYDMIIELYNYLMYKQTLYSKDNTK